MEEETIVLVKCGQLDQRTCKLNIAKHFNTKLSFQTQAII